MASTATVFEATSGGRSVPVILRNLAWTSLFSAATFTWTACGCATGMFMPSNAVASCSRAAAIFSCALIDALDSEW